MKLPLDEWGNLDAEAIEYLLTVHEYLELLYIASLPNQTSFRRSMPDHLNDRRSVNKLLVWGLLTAKAAPEPDLPRRHSLTLTPNGEFLAARYASETNRLLVLRAEQLATLPPAS